MKIYWPDVIHPLNHSHFWKHEWEKHGTCAAQVDALNSQKKYFGGSLDLYRGLELNRNHSWRRHAQDSPVFLGQTHLTMSVSREAARVSRLFRVVIAPIIQGDVMEARVLFWDF